MCDPGYDDCAEHAESRRGARGRCGAAGVAARRSADAAASRGIGWYYRFGTAETAAAVRTWSRDGRILAVGMLDSPTLVRMTVAPDAFQDEDLARRLVEDFSLPERGVLPEGAVSIEAPQGLLLHDLLTKEGWGVDEPWTPLLPRPHRSGGGPRRADQGDRPGAGTGLRPTSCGPRSTPRSPRASTGTRWPRDRCTPTPDAWCLRRPGQRRGGGDGLVGRPGEARTGRADGRPPDHRGRGYGRAITVAGAAALREMGSSSVRVCTPSSNVGGVATYKAAGFQRRPEIRDLYRDDGLARSG